MNVSAPSTLDGEAFRNTTIYVHICWVFYAPAFVIQCISLRDFNVFYGYATWAVGNCLVC